MPGSLGRDPTTAAVEGASRAALSHATEESNLGTAVTGEARCRPRNRSRRKPASNAQRLAGRQWKRQTACLVGLYRRRP
jgi:hypothetical protein